MDAIEAKARILIVHSVWSGGVLRLWAESDERLRAQPSARDESTRREHRYAAQPDAIGRLVELLDPDRGSDHAPVIEETELLLPVLQDQGEAMPSPALAHAAGLVADAFEQGVGLERFRVPAIVIGPDQAGHALDRLMDLEETGSTLGDEADTQESDQGPDAVGIGESVRFHASVLAMARHLLAEQRFVPMLTQRSSGVVHGGWMPWVGDEATAREVEKLVRAMPPSARAAVDEFGHQPWGSIADMLARVVDAEVRRVLVSEDMLDTVRERDSSDPQVAWLQGLLGWSNAVEAGSAQRQEMIRRIRRWIGGLEERGASAQWRLCLRLNEPLIAPTSGDGDGRVAQAPAGPWSVSFHLQAVETPELIVDAPDIWAMPADEVTIGGQRLEHPQELLLGELGRAARFFKALESALDEAEPIEVQLATEDAYRFLRELRPVLTEQGFGVQTPGWWDSPESRLGARLRIDGGEGPEGEGDRGLDATGRSAPQLGLATLVEYHWEIAVGDTTLSLKEFEQLASRGSPLVRIGGRWVEVRPEDVEHAIRFIRENPGGKMNIGDAMALAFGSDARQTGLPVIGIEAEGWLGAMLGSEGQREALPTIDQPVGFQGTLRPYQVRGLSWMAFMERFGLGVCLADDMGLGKTIQLLALLQHERESAGPGEQLGPTLLVAPTSVLGNWRRESERFAPEIDVLVHHGPDRLTGQEFLDRAGRADLVVTTYALAHRDRELFGAVMWRRVVLDEAQSIKNPAAKQSQAARSLPTQRRIALTGTPVENRLSELWSVMDFLNPGYLGDPNSFRKRFSIPIERYHDAGRAQRLRQMVRPFVLRRLKTDPTVVSDLPEKLESREYCHLTGEQASLYENCVQRMLGEVERAEGIQRRGLVLSALIRLKQICNHPSQLLKDVEPGSGRPPAINRSGKAIRLTEQLEEVLAESEQALIFTQFRQMGHLLSMMLRTHFDTDVLFLHGGTPQKQRQSMIDVFQRRDGTHPILILSLKAGGVGLNLTAATHVFHYDRWWNPAVENQATDRAYRIGQTRTVVVHKYLVRGTLEERIDQMIEQKTELAENIIGSGERWLTELSTDDLRSILTLRADAIGEDA